MVQTDDTTATRQDLLDRGWTVKGIASAVRSGRLVRVRRGHYAAPDAPPDVVRAVRIGGRLCCVSEVRRRGVWCLDDGRLHVRMAVNAARSRHPDAVGVSFVDDPAVARHWSGTTAPGGHGSVDLVDALAQLVRCTEPRNAIAAMESALRHRLVDRDRLARALPAYGRRLLARCDPAAESGTETFVRLLLRALGLRVRTQVWFGAHIRVDLLVEDWVVVECDSEEFHGDTMTTRDRLRDAELVRRGRTVLRFRYATIVFDPVVVARTVIEAIRAHRRVRNSGRIAARALARLRAGAIS